jgi:hypothetical protein
MDAWMGVTHLRKSTMNPLASLWQVLVVVEFSSEGSRTSRTQDGKGCPAAKVMPGPM